MCIACIFSQLQFSFWLRVLFSAPLGQTPTPNRSRCLKGYVFQVTSLILERIWMKYCGKLTLYSPLWAKISSSKNWLQGRTRLMLSCYQDWSNYLTLCLFFFFGSNHLSIWYFFLLLLWHFGTLFFKAYSHPMACLAGAPWQRSLAGRCLQEREHEEL